MHSQEKLSCFNILFPKKMSNISTVVFQDYMQQLNEF